MQQIHLTTEEEHLFSTIINAASWKKLDEVSIRVAGGWVRDKLLEMNDSKKDCSNHEISIKHIKNNNVDIDIALGGMNGVDFATIVKDYLEVHHPNETTHKIGVIMANPDQSKHLETVSFNLKF